MNKTAFTLAEVLITLGIIGIVAAMTLPSIIQKQYQKEASSRLKKFYSAMSQAILLSEVDNGPLEYWDKKSSIMNDDGSYNSTANDMLAEEYFDKYFAKYLKIASKGYLNEDSRKRFQTIFADGSSANWGNGGCIDITYDVNGGKNPNLLGFDRFPFTICHDKKPAFTSYTKNSIKSRDIAVEKCKTTPQYCVVVLEFDNWEFKSDYPWPTVKKGVY